MRRPRLRTIATLVSGRKTVATTRGVEMSGDRVAIIGGGIAGLNTARLLRDAGMRVSLFEARNRIGGRVLSVDHTGAASADGVDTGPSWFWPRRQPAIARLIDDLGLESFPQSSDGDVLFERMSRESVQRYTPREPVAESMRLVGGSGVLASALAARLAAVTVELGTRVSHVEILEGSTRLGLVRDDGRVSSAEAEHVVLAVPPRLAEATIVFSPRLDAEDAAIWRGTPTWMAGQAKFFAFYDAPFWRDDGLSGTAQSMVGPMPEIHDATTSSGRPALLGFLGISAAQRRAIGQSALTDACLAQLARLFGPVAQLPAATLIQDWAEESLTATAADEESVDHPTFAPVWVRGAWSERLILAASEVSPREAGYLSGAVEASALAASEVLRRVRDSADGG